MQQNSSNLGIVGLSAQQTCDIRENPWPRSQTSGHWTQLCTLSCVTWATHNLLLFPFSHLKIEAVDLNCLYYP